MHAINRVHHDTMVDVKSPIPGSVPAHELEGSTKKLCSACGTDLVAKQAEFDRGVTHVLNVLFRKFIQRGMPKAIATHLVLWIKSDVEL